MLGNASSPYTVRAVLYNFNVGMTESEARCDYSHLQTFKSQVFNDKPLQLLETLLVD